MRNSTLSFESLETRRVLCDGQEAFVIDMDGDSTITTADMELADRRSYEGGRDQQWANALACQVPWYNVGQFTQRFLGISAGDADYDGKFDSDDLLEVFAAGKYNTGEFATFSQGDWDHDGEFDSDDLIRARQQYGNTVATEYLATVSAVHWAGSRAPLGSYRAAFDWNDDGQHTDADIAVLLEKHDLPFGDFDFDGEVDLQYYEPGGRWRQKFNISDVHSNLPRGTTGDADGNGWPNIRDLELVFGEDVDPNDFWDQECDWPEYAGC